MLKVVKLLLLLVLLESSDPANGDCWLNNEYIQNSPCTFITTVNNQLQLQRFPIIGRDKTLSVYCPQGNNDFGVTEIKCDRNDRLQPPNPIMMAINAKVTQVPADRSCKYKLYSVAITIKDIPFELYRACYDTAKLQTHFSEAKVYYKTIHPKSPRPQFTTDGLLTPNQADSFKAREVKAAFTTIYGARQNYVNSPFDIVINRGHLTAAGDMNFFDQMYATFKYVNVVPQFESINSGNWLQIEHWVGNHIPEDSFLLVRTGALGVLSLDDFRDKPAPKPAYLIPATQQIPVPEWMYKIVRDANNRLLRVFLTYNNRFKNDKLTPHKCCQTVGCRDLTLSPNIESGITYCCKPAEFVGCLRTL